MLFYIRNTKSITLCHFLLSRDRHLNKKTVYKVYEVDSEVHKNTFKSQNKKKSVIFSLNVSYIEGILVALFCII